MKTISNAIKRCFALVYALGRDLRDRVFQPLSDAASRRFDVGCFRIAAMVMVGGTAADIALGCGEPQGLSVLYVAGMGPFAVVQVVLSVHLVRFDRAASRIGNAVTHPFFRADNVLFGLSVALASGIVFLLGSSIGFAFTLGGDQDAPREIARMTVFYLLSLIVPYVGMFFATCVWHRYPPRRKRETASLAMGGA